MAFTEGTIYDAEGNACAHATGTFKYVAQKRATIFDEQGRACAHATGTFKYVRKRLPTGPASANEQRPPSTD